MGNNDSNNNLEKLWFFRKVNKTLMIVSYIIHFIFGFLIPVVFICPIIYGVNLLWLMGFPRNKERDFAADSLFLKATVAFNIITVLAVIIGFVCLILVLCNKKHPILVIFYSTLAIVSNLMVGFLAYSVFRGLAVFLYILVVVVFVFLIVSSVKIYRIDRKLF